MKTPTTTAAFKRWLREQLNYFLEWEAVGYQHQTPDDDWYIDETRRIALSLELPSVARLAKHCRSIQQVTETLAACLAELTKSDWVELDEAARIIGCSVSGLRKLVGRGAIQFAQSGKHCRIRFKREWLADLKAAETLTVVSQQHPKAVAYKRPTTVGNSPGKLRVYFPSTG